MTAPATVLIVDDSMVVRAVLRAHLDAAGYRVLEAEDGPTALSVAGSALPDLILLDIEMPGLDGHQVLAVLKADPGLRHIPVVFLTNRAGTDDVVAGLNGGAHDYLRKPFEPAELIARAAAATHVKRLQDELRARNEQLDRLSRTDALTMLYNRRHLSDELQRRRSSARRHDDPLAVLLFDIDHFKRVNDNYGHPAGDQVLAEFGRLLTEHTRGEDIAGRWGGEEFLVILPRTDLAGAYGLAERIRLATAGTPIRVGEHDISITVSGGCALGNAGVIDGLVSSADAALYNAKLGGRNQIAVAGVAR